LYKILSIVQFLAYRILRSLIVVGEQNSLGEGGQEESARILKHNISNCMACSQKKVSLKLSYFSHKICVISLKKGLHFQICLNIFKFARITSKRLPSFSYA